MLMEHVESAFRELYRGHRAGLSLDDPPSGKLTSVERSDRGSSRPTVAFILGNTLLSKALRSHENTRNVLSGLNDPTVVFAHPNEVDTLEITAPNLDLALVDALDDSSVLRTVTCLRCMDENVPIMLVVSDDQNLSGVVAHLIRSNAVKAVVHASIASDLWAGVLRLVLNGGSYLPTIDGAAENGRWTESYGSSHPAGGKPYPNGAGGEPIRLEEGERLTTREREILTLLSEGHQNKIIASDLSLSEHTVKVHLQNLYRKLGVHNRTQAVAVGRRLNAGLLD